ncbi:hypothetical protein ACFLYY_02405 [Patescibacteria group bacterium]
MQKVLVVIGEGKDKVEARMTEAEIKSAEVRGVKIERIAQPTEESKSAKIKADKKRAAEEKAKKEKLEKEKPGGRKFMEKIQIIADLSVRNIWIIAFVVVVVGLLIAIPIICCEPAEVNNYYETPPVTTTTTVTTTAPPVTTTTIPSTTPIPTLPTKAEVEALLPEAWYVGIPFDLMLSRIDEKFPTANTRAEFKNGAKFLVVTVQEGNFFVAPENKLLPW